MEVDRERIGAILAARHSYYGARDIPIRRDTRWYPTVSDTICNQVLPEMRVLDVGCGDAAMLLELAPLVHSGVGIDNDPEHIGLAETARQAHSIANIEFLMLDFPGQIARLEPESFDLVYSLRGPVGDTSASVAAALTLLRRGGLLFCEEIGEHHQHEVRTVFDRDGHPEEIAAQSVRLGQLMERNGLDIRLIADVFTKWIYPDVYAWFEYQCNIWSWLGMPLPDADDPRIGWFAERNQSDSGEIAVTHHVVRVAGVR